MLVFTCRTVARNEDYRFPYRLWTSTVVSRPRNFQAWNNLGTYHVENGNNKYAKTDFLQSVQINPYQVEGWFNLGQIYTLENDKKQARICYQNALNINPSYKEAKERLNALDN